MNYLRSAEILHTFADFNLKVVTFESKLEFARRALSIFQHHDGVSGTAKDDVMTDYNKMMIEGIANCKFVIQQSIHKLLTDPLKYAPDFEFKYFDFDDSSSAGGDDKSRAMIVIDENVKYIVIHNSHTYERSEIVEFLIDSVTGCVFDVEGKFVMAQIAPIWRYSGNGENIELEKNKFRLIFNAEVAALGLAVYSVKKDENCQSTSLSQINIYTDDTYQTKITNYPGQIQFFEPTTFFLKMNEHQLTFNKNGLMQSINSHLLTIEFMSYGTVETKSQFSGAYIFMPDGPAQPLNITTTTTVVVIEGKLESSMTANLPHINHTVILRNDSNALEIRNIVDIRELNNTEIIMRLSSQSVHNYNVFYTDLNGLQYVKRKILGLVPLSGNYYPINSGIFIEDDKARISLFTATPLGGSALDSGQMEIMQDRRLNQDDGRGESFLNFLRSFFKPIFRPTARRDGQQTSS
jgi:alpha-mannosidase II